MEELMVFSCNEMTCKACAGDMEGILQGRHGITGARVDYPKGLIEVRYDPRLISRKEVYLSVRGLGYKIEPVGARQGRPP